MHVGALALMLLPAAKAKGPAGAYDRSSLVDLIGHHAMAVEMAGHLGVRRLARAIIKAQRGEIEQFRDWLVAWHAN